MSRASERSLYLDNEHRLGERLDDDAFQCNWEWWLQCTMLYSALDANSLVSDEDADYLATVLENHWDDGGWQIARFIWGDCDGATTREFIKFLRRGGFAVVDLSSCPR